MTVTGQTGTARRVHDGARRNPFRHAPVMMLSLDRAGLLVEVNALWQRTLGYAEEDVVGRPFADLLSEESARRFQEAMRREVLLDPGHAEDVPVSLRRRDGDRLELKLSLGAEHDAAGVVDRVLGFLVPATHDPDAEAKVRQRDTWLRAILENAPVEIVLKDREGRLVAVSKNIMDARGAQPWEVYGKRTADFFPPEIAAVYEEADRRVVTTGEAVVQEVKEIEGGETRHIHNSKFPLRDPDGNIIGICSLSMDMTDVKRMEEQLYQAQKMEAVGKLTGGIAHDFNNLLMVISGNLDLVAEGLGSESREIRAALRAVERGSDLTRRLLAFSRKQLLQPRAVALDELLQEVFEIVDRTMGQSIEVTLSLSEGLPPIMADAGQLQSAILNLALNARDAMPRGGTLAIRAETILLDGRMTEAAPGRYVRLAVADTGTGIAPEALERVFEPFYTTKGVGQGSGLGLSMVYGFVKQTGGHVAISSEVGRGTTVDLYLPLAGTGAPETITAQ